MVLHRSTLEAASDPNITPEDAADFITSADVRVTRAVFANESLFLVVIEKPSLLVGSNIMRLISNLSLFDLYVPEFIWQPIAYAVDVRRKNITGINGLDIFRDVMVSSTGMYWFFNNNDKHKREISKFYTPSESWVELGREISKFYTPSESWVELGTELFEMLLKNEPRPNWRITSPDGRYWAKWEVSVELLPRNDG